MQKASSDIIKVRGAPRIGGMTFRRLTNEPDFEALADVIQKSRDADRYGFVDTPQDIESDFHHLQNCDPRRDMLLVEVNHVLVGFCKCEWRVQADGTRIYLHTAHLVPEWRRRGLRTALVRENERRIREIASGHPRNSSKFLEARSSYLRNPWKSLLEHEGYRLARRTMTMVTPSLSRIPKAPLPEGIELMPYEKRQLNRIFRAAAEAFRDEPNFTEQMFSDDWLGRFLESRAFQPRLWQVAWAGNEVAGASFNKIDEEENRKFHHSWGYLDFVFVRKPFRNRGLAAALIARSLEALKNQGVHQAAIGVDCDNLPAVHLYQKMGFRERDHFARYRKSIS